MKKIIKRLKFALDINYWCMSSRDRYKQIYLITNETKKNMVLPNR